MNHQSTRYKSGLSLNLPGLGALFVLTLRQHLHGRRLLILSLLFLIPAILTLVARLLPHSPTPATIEFVLVFYLIPHALITLTALLYSAGIIQDEVEEQTLTYLLLRPIPRWGLYLTRLAATLVVTIAITCVFTVLALIAIHWNAPELWSKVLGERVPRIVGLLALTQVSYCALFAIIGMVTRWALLAGIAYIAIFEALMANLPNIARNLTIMYYFRVLAVRWLNLADTSSWAIDLEKAPSASTCVATLLGASAACTVLGAVLTARREFRMKTPEGN